MNKTRYFFAIFFILCGLIISVLGIYGCITVKEYRGGITEDSPVASVLKAKYADGVWKLEDDPTLYYNFLTIEKIGNLPYKTLGGFSWIPAILGLAFLGLGISCIVKKDLLFTKKETK